MFRFFRFVRRNKIWLMALVLAVLGIVGYYLIDSNIISAEAIVDKLFYIVKTKFFGRM